MVPRITRVVQSVVVAFAFASVAQAGVDPVKDYLENFSPLGGGPQFFSDDTLLRLDIDLDGDGDKEVLLSIARNRNGKQGNGWAIYKREKNAFKKVGGITFSESKIFTGVVEEVHRYGLVSFWSAGGGEGTLLAYTIENGKVTETQIGQLERDENSERMRGQAVFDKYFGKKQSAPQYQASEINASEFGPKYNLFVEPRTFSQFISAPLSEKDTREPRSKYSSDDGLITGKGTPSTTLGNADGAASTALVQKTLGAAPPFSAVRKIVIGILLVGVLCGVHLAFRTRKVSDEK